SAFDEGFKGVPILVRRDAASIILVAGLAINIAKNKVHHAAGHGAPDALILGSECRTAPVARLQRRDPGISRIRAGDICAVETMQEAERGFHRYGGSEVHSDRVIDRRNRGGEKS